MDRLDRIVQAYADAETWLMALIAEAVASGADGTAQHYQRQLGAVQGVLTRADVYLARLEAGLVTEVTEAMLEGFEDGAQQALATIPTTVPPPAPVAPTGAVTLLATETASALASQRSTILRSVNDAYRQVVQQITTRAVTSGANIDTTMQAALNAFANRGITSFVDRSGRSWGIDTYTRMALRTATNRAANEGRRETFVSNGVDLVQTSWHSDPAPVCEPYAGKILSLDGRSGPREVEDRVKGGTTTVDVTATMEEAIENGYHHPNAILGGDQAIDTFAGAVGASKAIYRGPAITIRTAKGHLATVSPEHPILTGSGWKTAESLSVGDNLFNPAGLDTSPTHADAGANVDDVPTTVEDEFVAVKEVGSSFLVPSAGHNFDDDRQFIEGEIDVVVTDHCLLPVPDAKVVKDTGEVHFMWTDMGGVREVRSSTEPLSAVGVVPALSVAGALPNLDALGLEATADGRIGDVEHGADLLAGHSTLVEGDDAPGVDLLSLPGDHPGLDQSMPCGRVGDSQFPGTVADGVPGGIELDEVVGIDLIDFSGHAYDFQTVDGIYSVNYIIMHNCRHTDSAYIPGTQLPDPPEVDPDDYRATQRQRAMERNLRHWRRREAVAVTPQAKQQSKAKVKAWRSALQKHVKAHDHLRRNYSREKVWSGNPADVI